MIRKFAITAFALSMSAAFAANNQPSTTSANSMTPSASTEVSASKDSRSSMSSASSSDSSQVKQVQQALKDKGQDPGAIDGKMGPKTQAALQSFQQAQGISGSGSLDQQTLAALGVSGGASASASSSTSSDQPATSANQPTASTDQPAPSSSQPAESSSNQPSSTTQSSPTNSTKQ